MKSLKVFFSDIKLTHSVFALPFALATFFLLPQIYFSWSKFVLVILCMFLARTFAMAINRLADFKIDALNSRTTKRALPSQRISLKTYIGFTIFSAVLFVLTCYFLNEKVFYFSVPLLLFLASYSWTKRFTFLCHLWLGICLGLSPLAVSLALSESIERGLFYLTAAIAFWTAGFDIIYSLQDRGFDKEKKLSSIPARYGKKIAIIISQIFFVIAIFCFVALGRHFNLAESYFRGILVIAILLFWEQKIIRPLITEKVSREEELVLIEKAFFRANAWVGFVFLVSVIFAKGFF